MKTIRLGVTFILLGSLSAALAEVDVDARIEAIKSATAQERVRLVNDFKTTLSTLSRQERAEAIEKFRSSMENDGEKLKLRERVRERVRINQMDETMERQQNQRMNQNQVGSQFLQQNPGVAPDAGTTPNRFMNK